MNFFFSSSLQCTVWTVGGLCSGHGKCFEIGTGNQTFSSKINTFCRCDPYWSGQGHFINLQNYDCSLHIPTAMGFHILMVLILMRTLYIVSQKSYEFIITEKTFRTNVTPTFTQIVINTWKRQPGFKACTMAIFCSIFGILVGINQLRGRYIGDTVTGTAIYIFYLITYWITATYTTYYFAKITLAVLSTSQDEKEKIRVAQRTRIHPGYLLLAIFMFQLGPTFTLGFTTDRYLKDICTFIWASTWILVYSIMCISLIKTNSFLAHTFEQNKKQNFIERMRRYDVVTGIKRFVRQVQFNLIFVLIVYGIGIGWVWFRTRFTYVIPVFMSLSSIAFAKGAQNLSTSGGVISDHGVDIFIRIVADPAARNIFDAFLAKEHSAENLQFWCKVQEFRDSFETPEAKFRRQQEQEEQQEQTELSNSDATQSASSGSGILVLNSTEVGESKTPLYNNPFYTSARDLYLYLSYGSINLPHSIRGPLDQWFVDSQSQDPSLRNYATSYEVLKDVFSSAQVEIFNLIRSDPLRRFQLTDEFVKLKYKWLKEEILGGPTKETSKSKNSRLSRSSDYGEDLEVPIAEEDLLVDPLDAAFSFQPPLENTSSTEINNSNRTGGNTPEAIPLEVLSKKT